MANITRYDPFNDFDGLLNLTLPVTVRATTRKLAVK